jgi:hypothetical protein
MINDHCHALYTQNIGAGIYVEARRGDGVDNSQGSYEADSEGSDVSFVAVESS